MYLLSFLLSFLFSIKISTVFLLVKENENRPRASLKFLQIPYSRNPVNKTFLKISFDDMIHSHTVLFNTNPVNNQIDQKLVNLLVLYKEIEIF